MISKRISCASGEQTPSAAQLVVLCFVGMLAGCGTLKNRNATEQLLVSDAVDRSIASIDFSPLANQKVFLDTKYITDVKGMGFVNSQYLISSLRQQMLASHCFLQDTIDDADYVVEARVGTLGADDHEVNYGIPQSNSVNAATSLIPGAPPLPMIPELSLAKKSEFSAAAKIGIFAYDRRTKEPVWQSGLAKGRSTAKAVWVLGAGPFETGTVYEGTQFAGTPIGIPSIVGDGSDTEEELVTYYDERVFKDLTREIKVPAARLANHSDEEELGSDEKSPE